MSLARVLPLLVATQATAEPARDRLTFSVDSYTATLGGEPSVAIADVASSLVYEHGGPTAATSLRLDVVDRESLIGGAPRRELHELNLTLGRARDRWSLRVGRQRIPGGFWLFADGVALRHAIAPTTTIELLGGLRAFSNARAELVLTTQPTYSPLAALAITRRTATTQVGGSLVATRDVVTLPRGTMLPMGEEPNEPTSRHVLPELFADVSGLTQPSSTLALFGGATVGNRYEVELSPRPDLVVDDPSVRARLLRSFGGFLAADHRPSRRHRFVWSANAVLAKTQFAVADDPLPRPSASFVELGGRYRWTANKRWRLALGNRLRLRDGDLVERPTVGITYGHPERTAIVVEAGVDLRLGQPTGEGFAARRSWVTNASVRHHTGRLDTRVGISYADVLPGSALATLRDDAPAELRLFPYTLEAQQYVYTRTFVQVGSWSFGADLEWALGDAQLRSLVQIGYSR